MWCEAGYRPDDFWSQTPRHLQLVMRGVRRRLKGESEEQLSLAWHTAAFSGAAQSKAGLKPLHRYLGKPERKMTHREMLANMQALAASVNRSKPTS